jgi:hypothetical protein
MGTLSLGSFLGKEVIINAKYDDTTKRVTSIDVANTGKFDVSVTLIDPVSKTSVIAEKPKPDTTASYAVTNGRECKTSVGTVVDIDYEIRMSYPAGK